MSSANAKVLNFTSNVASLLVFLYLGHVNIKYGLATGAGQIIGAYLGSHLAIAKGSSLVRVVFLSVTTVMLLKLVYDYISNVIGGQSMPHKSDVQVALISGGTSGIGFATAKLLLKEGWCVVINGRNEKSGQKAKTKLRRYSSKVQYIQGDVSNLKIVSAL